MGLLMASNAFSRIVAPPAFGVIYEAGHDAPWYAGAAMIALVAPLGLQIVNLMRRQAAPVT
jgi:hypothetical protein